MNRARCPRQEGEVTQESKTVGSLETRMLVSLNCNGWDPALSKVGTYVTKCQVVVLNLTPQHLVVLRNSQYAI